MILNLNELKQSVNLETNIVSITGDGTFAVVELANHNLQDGAYITIKDSTHFAGTFPIKRVNSVSFKFKSLFVGTDNSASLVSGSESVLERIAKSCEELILKDCGLVYGETAEQSEVYDIYEEYIRLNRGEVNQVISIKLSSVSEFSDASKFKLLAVNKDYRIHSERIELLFDYSQYLFISNSIEITYSCKECPAPVIEAIRQSFDYFWRLHTDKASALNSSTSNQNTYTYQKTIPEYIRQLYMNYKRHF